MARSGGPGGRLDRGSSTGRRAELDARIVDVKINRPFGQPENLRDLSRVLTRRRGRRGQRLGSRATETGLHANVLRELGHDGRSGLRRWTSDQAAECDKVTCVG